MRVTLKTRCVAAVAAPCGSACAGRGPQRSLLRLQVEALKDNRDGWKVEVSTRAPGPRPPPGGRCVALGESHHTALLHAATRFVHLATRRPPYDGPPGDGGGYGGGVGGGGYGGGGGGGYGGGYGAPIHGGPPPVHGGPPPPSRGYECAAAASLSSPLPPKLSSVARRTLPTQRSAALRRPPSRLRRPPSRLRRPPSARLRPRARPSAGLRRPSARVRPRARAPSALARSNVSARDGVQQVQCPLLPLISRARAHLCPLGQA